MYKEASLHSNNVRPAHVVVQSMAEVVLEMREESTLELQVEANVEADEIILPNGAT